MMISEAERLKIAQTATEIEIRAMRAREREAAAKEAAKAVRVAEAQRVAEESQRRAQKRDELSIAVLEQAARLVDRPPASISLLHFDGRHGRRFCINAGHNRFSTDHLADYNLGTATIKLKADLVKKRRDLIAACASIAASLPVNSFVSGADYNWE
jgi:hypothetical protein